MVLSQRYLYGKTIQQPYFCGWPMGGCLAHGNRRSSAELVDWQLFGPRERDGSLHHSSARRTSVGQFKDNFHDKPTARERWSKRWTRGRSCRVFQPAKSPELQLAQRMGKDLANKDRKPSVVASCAGGPSSWSVEG